MKISKLTIHNIGIIGDTVLPFDKPLILFYGEVMSGKTTILNAVRWVFGGSFPDDIIKHGKQDAHAMLEGTEDGKPWCIRREWYVAKDGSTKARTITFTRNGVPIKNPVSEIAKFLNPFLLDQNHLANMNQLERGRYLTELFGVDTATEDAAILEAGRKAQELRIIIRAYGDIDLTPVETVDLVALQADKLAAMTKCRELSNKINAENKAAREHNADVQHVVRDIADKQNRIAEIEAEIKTLLEEKAGCAANIKKSNAWLKDNPEISEQPEAPPQDTSEIDAKLQSASGQNVRAEQYRANVKRDESRKADNSKLAALEKAQADLKATKVAKLAKVDASAKVPGLKFLDAGRFEFEGVSDGMLSDSQLMRLSAALSGLYPEGFGITLIDRGESLGKSVLALNAEAQARESTILCTIVGEKPAKVPEHVGAYVVEKGNVK